LAEFDFLRRLAAEQKGVFPELEKYKALLDQMQLDMQEQAPAVKKEKEETFTTLKNRLSPLGRISFAIFRGDQDSYVNLIKLWVHSVGMPTQWQDIFLMPVWQAYFLGMNEVEIEMAKMWTQLRQNDLVPLYNKFPFDMASREDATVELLRNATHPAGHFWQTFRKVLAPFCLEEEGQWRRRSGPYDYPRLPANMIATVNSMARVSNIFWDKEGKERPLEFMVKSSPLFQAQSHEPIAVLSYLQLGDTTVLSFNQQPTWKKMKFFWHSPSKASVGAEFAVRKRASRVKSAIEIPSSYWSFYHLLLKTEEYAVMSKFNVAASGDRGAGSLSGADDRKSSKTTRLLTWIIDTPAIEVESRPIDIKFFIQSDPWALLKLPR
jgi:type VI protein secretion system component VasK